MREILIRLGEAHGPFTELRAVYFRAVGGCVCHLNAQGPQLVSKNRLRWDGMNIVEMFGSRERRGFVPLWFTAWPFVASGITGLGLGRQVAQPRVDCKDPCHER